LDFGVWNLFGMSFRINQKISYGALNELDNRFVPMPDSMMAEILAGEEIVSAKEAMEAVLTSHRAIRSTALYNLIRFYKTDTVNPSSYDSLIALLQNQGDLSLKYQLAFEYLRTGDTTGMDNVLSQIPNEFSLTPQQISIHNDYLTYLLFRKNLIQNGHNIFTSDSTSLSLVYNLCENGSEPVRSYARNILIARGEFDYSEPILLPDELKSSDGTKSYRTSRFTEKSYMRVFPNPARKYVIVEYNLKELFMKDVNARLVIADIQGVELFRTSLNKLHDQLLVITSEFRPGMVICSLQVNSKVVESQKVIIIE